MNSKQDKLKKFHTKSTSYSNFWNQKRKIIESSQKWHLTCQGRGQETSRWWVYMAAALWGCLALTLGHHRLLQGLLQGADPNTACLRPGLVAAHQLPLRLHHSFHDAQSPHAGSYWDPSKAFLGLTDVSLGSGHQRTPDIRESGTQHPPRRREGSRWWLRQNTV